MSQLSRVGGARASKISDRPVSRANALRELLAETIQALVDAHNADAAAAFAGRAPAPAAPRPAVPPELLSPGLLSLDLGAALLMGAPHRGAAPRRTPVHFTLLSAAAIAGALPVVRQLLDGPYGCQPDEGSRSGVSPLLAACYAGHADVAEALLDCGGGRAGRRTAPVVEDLVNLCVPSGACGRTLVEAAVQGPRCSAGGGAVLRLLVARGLRPNGVDAQGRLPLDIAIGYGRPDVASALLQAGARWTPAAAQTMAARAKAQAAAVRPSARDSIAGAGAGAADGGDEDAAWAELEAFAAMATRATLRR